MKDDYKNYVQKRKSAAKQPVDPTVLNKQVEAPKKLTNDFSYWSKVLEKPFESLEELKAAEETYFAELKAKEDKITQKKADARKVEEAFAALNEARRTYKDELAELTKKYSEDLVALKDAFDKLRKEIHGRLATAEDTYSKALKEFTDKYDQYHMCLKDGDFETTISGSRTKNTDTNLLNLFDLLFNF
jgi:chromosome segregation ATPase